MVEITMKSGIEVCGEYVLESEENSFIRIRIYWKTGLQFTIVWEGSDRGQMESREDKICFRHVNCNNSFIWMRAIKSTKRDRKGNYFN